MVLPTDQNFGRIIQKSRKNGAAEIWQERNLILKG